MIEVDDIPTLREFRETDYLSKLSIDELKEHVKALKEAIESE